MTNNGEVWQCGQRFNGLKGSVRIGSKLLDYEEYPEHNTRNKKKKPI